jgi:hypothetical protein
MITTIPSLGRDRSKVRLAALLLKKYAVKAAAACLDLLKQGALS